MRVAKKGKNITDSPEKKAKNVKKTASKKTASAKVKSSINLSNVNSKTLIIVESPTKAKSLSKMLGSNYIVRSSIGHIRDLPKSRMAVDIENNFKPEYILVKGKTALKNELSELSKHAKNTLLASDPDREGEAIAWHLADLLEMDPQDKCRVRFYEITPNAVKDAVKKPEEIDVRKVDAQQARRILDRLVGYTLSPVLWKKVRFGLSAGRVQSVALALICMREREILSFIPEEYWTIVIGASSKDNKREYMLRAHTLDGVSLYKEGKSLLIKNEATADRIISEIKANRIIVSAFNVKESLRKAPPPFRTSTLQQEASRRTGFAPRRTMRIAQELFEGITIPGKGTVGLITYMRTDSLRLAEEAINSCRDYIKDNFGNEYLPKSSITYSANGRSQDAHEAIRPTDITLSPESIKKALSPDQFKLYDIIWRRAVACQMSPAVVANSTLDAQSGSVGLRQLGEVLIFEGYGKVWPLELKGERMENAIKGEELKFKSAEKEQKFTRPPARYSEASLIKKLEEDGVGRPSTYASIVDTLYDRNYVKPNEEKRLEPTPLGTTVDDFLHQYFNNENYSSIVDVGFTAKMEKNLDEVEEDRRKWLDVVSEFWKDFSPTVEEAQNAERVKLPEAEPIGEDCPNCGHSLVLKNGRFGDFIACSGYPNCKYTRPILEKIGIKCPKCGETDDGHVVKRRSRNGRTFYGCSKYPNCDYVSWNKPMSDKCPECGAIMENKGKTIVCPQCG
ncbi:MAG: type I DNA topoisomerase [Synergistaceae bacterium]|nr:type I DNA topoisomerase [Synergistaceae bacterium]